jgi:hypothetical protein
MWGELVSRGLVSVWLLLVALRWQVAPRSPARRRQPAPRQVRRQWAAVAQVGPRVVGLRLQVVVV